MSITAETVIDRIRRQCGVGWRPSEADALVAGRAEAQVRGIVTTYAPSLEVLHKAVAMGANMIVALESPFWLRPASLVPGLTNPTGLQDGPPGYRPAPAPPTAPGSGGAPAVPESDALLREKRAYIAAHDLVIYRFVENWGARQPDPQLGALVAALGWSGRYRPPTGAPWATRGAAFVDLAPAPLRAVAQSIKSTLNVGAIRVIGRPETIVRKAAVKPGIALLIDLQRYFAEPGVDLVIMGEAIWENEGMQYMADIVASGQDKGLILLGQAVSQGPGCGEMAAWLRSFVSEVPVSWISTGDPTWAPDLARGTA